jgi:hypothetical protein
MFIANITSSWLKPVAPALPALFSVGLLDVEGLVAGSDAAEQPVSARAIVSALAASARLGACMVFFSLSGRIRWVGEMRLHGCGRIGSIKSG